MSRAGLARLLKREGFSRLEDVIPKAEGETISAKKTFKDHEPGFVHVDINYLPQMPDESAPLSVRGHRPRHALGVLAHLRRYDRQKQRRLPAPAQAGLADQDHQTAD